MSKRAGRKSQSSNDFLEPKPVENLTATDVGTNRAYNNGALDISWTLPADSPEATSYTITTTPSTSTYTTSGTSYQITGLSSNTAYTVSVYGSNAAGDGQSTTSSSVTVTTVPQSPQSVSATAGVDKDTVSWSAGATGGKSITSYSITSSDSKSFTGIGSSPYDVTQEADTAQTYTIYAINDNGTSEGSTTNQVTTLPPSFFSPPYFPPFFPPFFPPRFFSPPFFSR